MKPKSELILYQTDDNRTRIEVRLEDGTVWLTQKLMAELFQKDVRTINEHIQNVFEEGELSPQSVIRKFRITAADGKTYDTQHYNLDVIISVGYRVKSHRGTQFRIWATQRLREYIVKGFTLDDERLKQGGTANEYFDELLQRIRDIPLSERNFYRKICDIYRTSVDYNPSAEMTQRFFQTVQNKMHWAVHGRTAAEIIHQRAIATQPHMGLTSWKVSTNVHPRIGTMNRRATLLGFGVPALAGCRFRYATTEACRLKPGLRTGPTDGDSWRGPARPRARVRVTNSTQRENCGVGQLRNFRLSTLIHGKPRN